MTRPSCEECVERIALMKKGITALEKDSAGVFVPRAVDEAIRNKAIDDCLASMDKVLELFEPR